MSFIARCITLRTGGVLDIDGEKKNKNIAEQRRYGLKTFRKKLCVNSLLGFFCF
jgi:hypothetical protein